MKDMFVLPMLISLAIICSCQKQDSTAEAQLAQRKTELDAREEALIQREKAVDEREKAVADREKALADSHVFRSQRRAPDAAQAEAERQKRIQQLPPEIRALIPDTSQVNAEKDRIRQQQPAERQRRLEELQRTQAQMQNQSPMSAADGMKIEAAKKDAMSAAAAPPAAVYPGAEATSPSPSPTPQ